MSSLEPKVGDIVNGMRFNGHSWRFLKDGPQYKAAQGRIEATLREGEAKNHDAMVAEADYYEKLRQENAYKLKDDADA